MKNSKTTNDLPDRPLQKNREVWLLGQPPLRTYLKYVIDNVVDASTIPQSVLINDWRTANEYYAQLELQEAGIAQTIETQDLDADLQALAEDVIADSRYKRAFDLLPTRIAVVEIDKMVVGQPNVSENHSQKIMQGLGEKPSNEKLFRFCLPLDRSEADVQMRQIGHQRYLFWSSSADFRFQEAKLLQKHNIKGYDPVGEVSNVLALLIGFGSNFLNLIEFEGRMLIHNGHHRLHALRSLGVTHAPCVVQTVTQLEELRLVASQAIIEDPNFYFVAKRPPVMKDFFNPKIRKVHFTERLSTIVEVGFDVKVSTNVKAF